MGRYLGAKLRIVRRLGPLPGLTGRERSLTERPKPGQHAKRNRKITKYGVRLEEKQRLRFNYGIGETQFLNYVKLIRKRKSKAKNPISQMLEMRLDAVIFYIGFAPTIAAARQLVTHRHIILKRQKPTPSSKHHHTHSGEHRPSQSWAVVSIPSFLCQKGDIISVKKSEASLRLVTQNLELSSHELIPSNIKFTKDTLEAEILKLSDGSAFTVKELLIMEHYSRRL